MLRPTCLEATLLVGALGRRRRGGGSPRGRQFPERVAYDGGRSAHFVDTFTSQLSKPTKADSPFTALFHTKRGGMKSRIAFVLAAMALPGCASVQDPELLSLAQRGMARGYPGMALIASAPGDAVRLAAAGMADAEHGRRLRPGDSFHIGSITKCFTAVAILRLIDAGMLSLDDRLAASLGKAVEHIPSADVITVRQLLDHSANTYPTNNDAEYLATLIGSAADPSRIWTPEEMLALADGNRRRPAGKPGEGHTYSDTDYTLLGMIVAKVSGMPLKQYVEREIFGPLNMASTYFYSDAIRGLVTPRATMVQGYLINTKEIREIISLSPIYKPVPQLTSDLGPVYNTTLASERLDAAGGVISTLPDLMKFGAALFRGKLLSAVSQTFLTAAGAGMDSLDLSKQRTWTLQAARKRYGVVLYKEGDGPGGTTAVLIYLSSQDRIVAGFTNSFGYFNEVDFILDEVMPALAAKK